MKNGESPTDIVCIVNGEMVIHRSTYVLELQTSVRELIELATRGGHGLHDKVRAAKELIRCTVTGCGMGGACNGRGIDESPCPLREVRS